MGTMVCQFKSLFPELRVSQPLEIGVTTHFQVLVVMSKAQEWEL